MQEYEPISEKNLQVPPLKQNSEASSGQLFPVPPIRCVSNNGTKIYVEIKQKNHYFLSHSMKAIQLN